MKHPRKKGLLLRMFMYVFKSFWFVQIFRNWLAIPLGVIGVIDFKKGYTLHLRDGSNFKIFHFMEALTLLEVFGENRYLLQNNNKVKTIIDIGANIGAFAIFAARRNPKARVIAYEPSRKTYLQLEQNVFLNSLERRININKVAIGKKRGKLRLYDSGVSGQRSIYKTRGEKKYEIVKTATMVDVFEKNGIKKCDFLKMDCEGAEYEILLNTPMKIFEIIEKISVEFHEMTPFQDHREIVECLIRAGYKVQDVYNKIENSIGYIYAKRQ